jgi:hypothetical protein
MVRSRAKRAGLSPDANKQRREMGSHYRLGAKLRQQVDNVKNLLFGVILGCDKKNHLFNNFYRF